MKRYPAAEMNLESSSEPVPPALPAGTPLRELAALFLRLGTTAFGGPAAHIAMMQDEVVTRRKWLTPTEFLDMLAATNFIPGPNSTEMSIHIGYRRAGWRGLVVAGSCFILPAALMCAALAALYTRYGHSPISQSLLYGVKPVVIAVVGQALYRLGRAAIKTPLLAALTMLAAAALLLRVGELLTLFGTGALAALLFAAQKNRRVGGMAGGNSVPLLAVAPRALGALKAPAAAAAVGGWWGGMTVAAPLGPLFLVFLKIGSVLFGSGYVLLAFLQTDVVDRHHWLTQEQLLDAIAVGQVTPGPVFTTATFIGYVAAGPWGAVLATLGIFVPAFFFVAASAPLLVRMRQSKVLGAFLDGLNVASLALMAVVMVRLAVGGGPMDRPALVDGVTIALAAASLALLILKKVNSMWLVLAGAVAGGVHGWLAG